MAEDISGCSVNGYYYDFIYGYTPKATVANSAISLKNQTKVTCSGEYVAPYDTIISPDGYLSFNYPVLRGKPETNIWSDRYSQTTLGLSVSQCIPKQSERLSPYYIQAQVFGGELFSFGNFRTFTCNFPVVGSASGGNLTCLTPGDIICKISLAQNKPRLIGCVGFKGSSSGMGTKDRSTAVTTLAMVNNPGYICNGNNPFVPINITARYSQNGLFLCYNGPKMIPEWDYKTLDGVYSTRMYINASWIEES